MADLLEELHQHQQELLPHTGQYIGQTNLDIGCGSGLTSVIHRQKLGVSPALCDVADIRDPLARSFPFSLIREGRLPFPDQVFESSYIQYVLHHLPTEKQVEELLAEAQRVSRRIILVEEILGPRTEIARAKEFDREVNARIHPGAAMPVYKYYSQQEIERFFKDPQQELLHHAVVATGTSDNGFLETHVFISA